MRKLDIFDRAAHRLFQKAYLDCTPDEKAECQVEVDAIEAEEDWDE